MVGRGSWCVYHGMSVVYSTLSCIEFTIKYFSSGIV